ncbi:MAG: hypothetical protein NTX32_06115 [Candidatus Firestonebacteria bacterium]|nr:hypothetical protein [Candidatus Firestonebacteria bacterium]
MAAKKNIKKAVKKKKASGKGSNPAQKAPRSSFLGAVIIIIAVGILAIVVIVSTKAFNKEGNYDKQTASLPAASAVSSSDMGKVSDPAENSKEKAAKAEEAIKQVQDYYLNANKETIKQLLERINDSSNVIYREKKTGLESGALKWNALPSGNNTFTVKCEMRSEFGEFTSLEWNVDVQNKKTTPNNDSAVSVMGLR